jgi:serine/threonine protein phosphatase PrpC
MDIQEPNIIGQLTCPSCRAVVFAGEDFCESCGHRLSEPVPATPIPLVRTGVPASGPPTLPDEGRPCVECGAAAIDADGYCGHCGFRQPTGRDHFELELAPGGPAGVSNKGLRHSKNEDAMALGRVPGGIAGVVCDGVSSSPRPEDASRTASEIGIEVLTKELEAGAAPQDASRVALEQAAVSVAALAAHQHDAPACTYVSAVATRDSLVVGWIGDSRAYWLPAAGGGVRLTDDDSWAGQMVSLGAMTEEEAQSHRNAHVLVAWLGADAGTTDPHVKAVPLDGPGTIVVCSDGLWNYLPEAAELAAALPAAGTPPLEVARSLVNRALTAGGHDNVTVVVIPVMPDGGG